MWVLPVPGFGFLSLFFFVLSASLGPVVTCVINAAAAARQGDWVTVNVSIGAKAATHERRALTQKERRELYSSIQSATDGGRLKDYTLGISLARLPSQHIFFGPIICQHTKQLAGVGVGVGVGGNWVELCACVACHLGCGDTIISWPTTLNCLALIVNENQCKLIVY